MTNNGTAPLVAAIESTWSALQKTHPELPNISVALAAGSSSKQKKYGHFAPERWVTDEGKVHELFIGAEPLQDGPAQLFATILHEAAHAYSHANGEKDTSRQGRYHNKTFKVNAAKLGYVCDEKPDSKTGFSWGKADELAMKKYKSQIDRLSQALSLYRVMEPERERKSNNNGVVAECACYMTTGEPRKIRVSKKVYRLGPITCGVCGQPFEADDDEDEE